MTAGSGIAAQQHDLLCPLKAASTRYWHLVLNNAKVALSPVTAVHGYGHICVWDLAAAIKQLHESRVWRSIRSINCICSKCLRFGGVLLDHARLHVAVHLQGRSRLKKKMWRRQPLKPCALDCSALIWLLTLSSVKSKASQVFPIVALHNAPLVLCSSCTANT